MRRRFGVLVTAGLMVSTGILLGAQPRSQETDLERSIKLVSELRNKVIDLTYAFDETTIYWPLDEHFHWDQVRWGRNDGKWYASATYGGSEHGGTHLDSPIHFAEGQLTADQIPVDRFIGPAVVVDVTESCQENPDYQVQVVDLQNWEATHGPIPEGAIVLFRTGWGRYWPDKKNYLGSDVPGDVENLHFPGIGPSAATWLVENRSIQGVGLDTASLDHGQSVDFETHRILCGAGLYGLENVAQLEKLPEGGATLIALPMKIGGGTGGPTRIIAILP